MVVKTEREFTASEAMTKIYALNAFQSIQLFYNNSSLHFNW